jgi:phosphoribosyl-AMP cyclohydrolase
MSWIDTICWTVGGSHSGHCPKTMSAGKVLTFAWMNRESLLLTIQEGYAVYWSRISTKTLAQRGRIWTFAKGTQSVHRL